MSKVFVTTYEIIDAGVALAKAHYQRHEDATAAQWAFVEEIGGCGLRPSSFGGGLSSVFFEQLPTFWREIGRDKEKIEARPAQNTKMGKQLIEQMQALPRRPDDGDLAQELGYAPSSFPTDGVKLYFATALAVAHPEERFFLRIPRQADDGFVPDEAMLKAVPESTLMLAVETHNAEAARLRALDGAEGAGEVLS